MDLDSTIDPVYPFDQPSRITQAPFINEAKGLTENPKGSLAVKAAPPLEFAADGSLTVAPVYVDLTSNQTIEGTKTFTGAVEVNTPTEDDEVANKEYVDNRIAEIKHNIRTFWTGVQATPQSTNFAQSLFIYCSLTRVGEMVWGQIGLTGVSGQWQYVDTSMSSPFYFNAIFTMDGKYIKGGNYIDFGPKVGHNVDNTQEYNGLIWAPNRNMYGGANKTSFEVYDAPLNPTKNSVGQDRLSLILALNDSGTASSGLSLRFTFVARTITQQVPLKTSLINFYYYPDAV